ncbi:MAG: short-chain dehydrogenase/reductase [bacterium]|nr:short-chain dehydrogenase/reductase [bacterium]
MAPLTDRVFVITGGGGALAGPIARSFAHAGARLVLVDRVLEHVAERAREHHATPLGADLTTLDGAVAMANSVVGRHGRIDGLVHTVGAFAMGRIVDSDAATYDRMFDLNVRTLFNTLRAVAPAMLARGDGFICAISSEPGWTGRAPGSALYGAAKSAATSLMRTLEAEARGTQVGVCIVYPMGAIDTPINRKEMPNADPQSFIDPGEIAASILHAATRSPRGRLSELPIHPPRPL